MTRKVSTILRPLDRLIIALNSVQMGDFGGAGGGMGEDSLDAPGDLGAWVPNAPAGEDFFFWLFGW